jgi:hypothetical protein
LGVLLYMWPRVAQKYWPGWPTLSVFELARPSRGRAARTRMAHCGRVESLFVWPLSAASLARMS